MLTGGPILKAALLIKNVCKEDFQISAKIAN